MTNSEGDSAGKNTRKVIYFCVPDFKQIPEPKRLLYVIVFCVLCVLCGWQGACFWYGRAGFKLVRKEVFLAQGHRDLYNRYDTFIYFTHKII